ncbi:LiaI-LiaF-like domain-containing protein [Solimicrobium silvestre]|uniref:Cell wall-active antibiotics response protein (DUF2154) n=1 Tax=Solimicrobium silvestre TaxID=2099400 RepID=A0A2S9H528_9BURK|nr:DUF5668 domain-containing protein [Solimicrobium silvestre]PRC95033.1 Cell wall-active antibiotics response protein (DUF2154) [Solimicrobium silvestre]
MSKYSGYKRQHRSPQSRLILGVFIVIIGVLSLIDNLGWFDTHQILSFWPVVFIILGVLRISQPRNGSSYFFGVSLLGLGVLLTLQNLGIIAFHWREWWPVLIIAMGISFIFRGVNRNANQSENNGTFLTDSTQINNSDSVEIVAVLSGSKSSNATPNFQGGDINTFMGSVELDLRSASLQNEATIHVFSVFGSVEIRVPNDWVVVLNGTPILGGIEDQSVPPMNSAKRLVISGVVVMGGVEIKN